jgi:hypothetical protein
MRVLAVLVLVIGFLLVWGGFTMSDAPEEGLCPELEVEHGWTFEAEAWPPGSIKCVVTSIDDEIVATNTFFPWRDYGTVVLFALAVAVLRPRPLRMLASLALVLAALALFFVGPSP